MHVQALIIRLMKPRGKSKLLSSRVNYMNLFSDSHSGVAVLDLSPKPHDVGCTESIIAHIGSHLPYNDAFQPLNQYRLCDDTLPIPLGQK